jgi:hypothetical protein
MEVVPRGSRTGSELTEPTLAELKTCEPIYRPTNFWDFALATILRDLDTVGLKRFKTWPTSPAWFYPKYGNGFSNVSIAATYEAAAQANPRGPTDAGNDRD